jgi:protein-tyrosine phosphatase
MSKGDKIDSLQHQTNQKIKILMICLGNICRSPLAEGILKSKVDADKVFVDSAGTGGWHVGHLPDKRSIKIAKEYAIDITNQRCSKFKLSDFKAFDFIYVMDDSNYNDIVNLAKSKEEIDKVRYVLNPINSNKNLSVPDPYYGGEEGFKEVYLMLNKACKTIANNLELS